MSTKTERDRSIHERWRARMENDFAPDHTPEQTPDPSLRSGGLAVIIFQVWHEEPVIAWLGGIHAFA